MTRISQCWWKNINIAKNYNMIGNFDNLMLFWNLTIRILIIQAPMYYVSSKLITGFWNVELLHIWSNLDCVQRQGEVSNWTESRNQISDLLIKSINNLHGSLKPFRLRIRMLGLFRCPSVYLSKYLSDHLQYLDTYEIKFYHNLFQ